MFTLGFKKVASALLHGIPVKGWDSLDHIEGAMHLEHKHQRSIEDKDLHHLAKAKDAKEFEKLFLKHSRPARTKIASFGDNHNDGSQFDSASQAIDPTAYNKPINPSANPSFDYSGGGKKLSAKKAEKQGALRLTLGLMDKVSAERDDTARGVSEGLDKEYNGADPVRNLDDAKAQKEVWKRQLRARKCSPKD